MTDYYSEGSISALINTYMPMYWSNTTSGPALALILNAINASNLNIYSVLAFGATGNGTTDDTTSIDSAITAAGNGITAFPQATYVVSGIATGQSSKIWGLGSTLSANTANSAILTIGSDLPLQTVLYTNIQDLSIVGNSLSNITGLVGAIPSGVITPYCGAQFIIERVYIEGCTIGFNFGSTQFMRNYSLQAYNCSNVGMLVYNDPVGGGGNSNDFYQPHLIGNAVGIVLDGTNYGTGLTTTNFYNPQCLGNTVCGMAFFTSNATVYGGAPEANGSGASSIVVNGQTVEKSSIYLNNSTVALYGFQIEEALVNPCIIISNNSILNCHDLSGYGEIFGQLIQADTSSAVNFSGNFAASGLVANVGSWPDSTSADIFAGLYGQPSLTVDQGLTPPLYASQCLPDIIASVGDPPTISFIEDVELGYCCQIVFQNVAGQVGGNSTGRVVTANTATSGPLVVSCLIKSTTVTSIGVSLTCNNTFAYAGGFQGNIALEANRPVRVVIITSVVNSVNPVFVWISPSGTDGPTLLVSNLQVYQGLSNTDPTTQADINHIVKDGAFWPGVTRDTATNIQSKAASVNIMGKYPGKQIWDTTGARVLFAEGSGNTDTWNDGANNIIYTPS